MVMGANSGFGSLSPRISLTTKSNATVTNRYRFAEVNSKAVGFYSNATSQTAETKRTGTTQRLMKEPSAHNDETPRGTLRAFMNGAATNQLSPYEAHHSSVMNVTARGGKEGNATSTPVFVMLPLDTVNVEGSFTYHRSSWFHKALWHLVRSGVKGVAVDIWWGVVEKNPMCYDWKGYRDLFRLIQQTGLLMQVVLSFHACGGNVGDVVQIPLPQWVLECGELDPDIFLSDRPTMHRSGQRNRECLSLFADEVPGILRGRSPMQCYTDFMAAFRDEFEPMLGALITDVVIGAGPCGELRYPSYSEANGWRFPGVGEFQCYDRHALSSLAKAAADAGHTEWGHGGPHNAGEYNNWPRDASFFWSHSGSWNTHYGHFFLQWYSDALLQHGRRLLRAANAIFATKLRQKGSSFVRSSESLMNGVKTWLAKTGGRLCRAPSTASVSDFRVSESSVSFSARTNSVTSIFRDTSLDSLTRDTTSCNSCQSGLPGDSRSCPSVADVGYSSVFDVDTGAFTPIKAPESSSTESNNGEDMTQSALEKRWDAGDFLRRMICFPKHEIEEEENPPTLQLTLKIAGVHWWYRTRSHAAELTAGYYNAGDRCGYEPIIQLCREFNFGLTLTCVEMCDAQHPSETCCSPQGLLNQIRRAASVAGVRLSGENALPLFYSGWGGVDEKGLDRVVQNCCGEFKDLDITLDKHRQGFHNNASTLQLNSMHSFTFLRLGPEITFPAREHIWCKFVRRMQGIHQGKDMDRDIDDDGSIHRSL